jgi:hypothetical protein
MRYCTGEDDDSTPEEYSDGIDGTEEDSFEVYNGWKDKGKPRVEGGTWGGGG